MSYGHVENMDSRLHPVVIVKPELGKGVERADQFYEHPGDSKLGGKFPVHLTSKGCSDENTDRGAKYCNQEQALCGKNKNAIDVPFLSVPYPILWEFHRLLPGPNLISQNSRLDPDPSIPDGAGRHGAGFPDKLGITTLFRLFGL